ncbi:PREDICTED: heterogeneous nuclear ribonucleoprotein 1-like isoform X3 [Camelina sativa]|uniref:Heterogeneous nuclear ribonucleoprotein 1-like isoform X1 n=1 Tax=Camelina sativa TaxID=90675 RepID=A0ABM0TZ11_CAMSA|nr:PREDICTED: heterogeneous nuclear ribonucleoprotein 1-like isoform X1 [Camelina sativa]XP_010433463.1 PREDICTED: heterogeneous nuclear ribonucleoprotein 1-like isoform X2 [Camelina sativa]XP_010433464.1 PREDICTED: heterogeneous nuclear ribonucleoprotein 1-like isoform X3 [Camelina sativa]
MNLEEQKMESGSDLGKLFIGGISWDTDEERLREYFGKYGDLVEAVIMRDRTTGRARGFGFIVFADPSVAERVIMEKHIIDGRTVEAKKAVPRDDQQVLKRHASPMHLISPSHGGNGGGARTKKIFVGGLPSSITEAEFKNYFDQFGTIADVVVMYDHNTQRPRGFGFITFDSEESVDMVLHKTFHELNGKMVEVKRAVPKELSSTPPNRSPLLGYGNNYGVVSNRSSANSYFNSFPPGYNNNNLGSAGRFSPIGSGRNAFSSFGLGLNQELNLNSNFDGNTLGYSRIQGNQYFNGASPNRYNSPIGYNRGDSAYNPSNRDLWGNRSDSSGPGWNLGVSGGGNNRGNWGLSSVTSDTNGYGRSYGMGSGLSGLSFSGNTNGFDGSIGELYRGNSVYSDSTWQQQSMPHNQSSSNEFDGLSRSYGFGIDNVGSDPSANASEGYPGNYNVGNRQTNRGIEA